MVSELFPDHADWRDARLIVVPAVDGLGDQTDSIYLVRCERCKAWTDDRAGHTAWHRSVDTDQTVRVVVGGKLTGYTRAGDVTIVPTDDHPDQ